MGISAYSWTAPYSKIHCPSLILDKLTVDNDEGRTISVSSILIEVWLTVELLFGDSSSDEISRMTDCLSIARYIDN